MFSTRRKFLTSVASFSLIPIISKAQVFAPLGPASLNGSGGGGGVIGPSFFYMINAVPFPIGFSDGAIAEVGLPDVAVTGIGSLTAIP